MTRLPTHFIDEDFMNFKNIVLTTLAAALIASPAMARTHVDLSFNVIPQAAYLPPQPYGVWVPGYWASHYGHRYGMNGYYAPPHYRYPAYREHHDRGCRHGMRRHD